MIMNRYHLQDQLDVERQERIGNYVMASLAVLFLGAVIIKGAYETGRKYFSSNQQVELKENGLERKIDSK